MKHERLMQLMARLESGDATDAELEELEALLADDYEARERFLDHAQLEGLLHGIGCEANQETVIEFVAEPKQVARFPWRSVVSAAVAAAVLVTGFVLWLKRPHNSEAPVVAKAEEPTFVPMSAEERYDRTATSEVGRASNVHPETAGKGGAPPADARIEFNRDIRPILSDNCFFCHGPDQKKRKADLRLDMEDGAFADHDGHVAIVKGKPEESELIARIHDKDPDSMMPPPESKRVLTSEEKALLQRWIEEGAEWQKHWAFEPPVKRDLPQLKHQDWPANEIDRFVLHRMEEHGLEPSPEADKATLIRRVSLDLTGLPPALEEVDAFLADESPDAYDKLVGRLLGTAAHAEKMAWHWMEAARYADTDGYQNDGPRDMWRWRDWVIEAYRGDMPFDRFTIEQLAGDLLPNPTRNQLIATGFNRNNRYNSEAGLVLEEFLLENAVDRVDTTMTVWMGLTMGCARCHDHKYDPLSQKDYYQLISYFDNVDESGRAIKMGNSEPWIKAPTKDQESELAEIDYRIAEAKEALASEENAIASAQAKWEQGSPDISQVVISSGLSYRYGADAPLAVDGETAVDLKDKVDGLVSNNRFSIAFTMIPDHVDKGVVMTNEIAGTTRKGFFVAFHEGRLRFSINSRWIAGVGMLETEQKFNRREKIHVALTNDGTQRADGMEIWINGEKVATRTLYNTNSNTAGVKGTTPVVLGVSKHHPSWKGTVSDLRFYSNRTLKPEEISVLSEPAGVDQIIASKERTELQSAKLRAYYLEHAAPPKWKRLSAAVAKVEAERVKYWDSLPTTMVMLDADTPKETHLRIRGEYHNKGEIVHSGIPEVFHSEGEKTPATRLEFARWLVGDENPLAARVAANHLWQMLFGTGLVKTAEDFGTQGSPPSHPDLLDWLAVEYRESGWDTRALLKEIVMSSTYRQSSEVAQDRLAKDPNNVYLSRAPRLKLSGSLLRDQALFTSGLLVGEVGGPSVKPYQPANLWKEASNFTYKQDKGESLHRRSLYTYWKRTLAPPSMAVLDAADREWCSVKPKRTNTPLQALTLLNETAFFEAARKLGERVVSSGVGTDEEKVRYAFRTVLARDPSQEELKILTNAYQSYRGEYEAAPEEAAAIHTVGEAKVAKDCDRIELAAATALANVILNLEETSVRE